MTSTYNFTLTDGSALTTVYALEGNGTGNLSIPRQVLDINFDTANPAIILADDVTTRFTNGFIFTITGGSPYDGTYTVTGTSTTKTSDNGQVVTVIPVATPPALTGFSIVDVLPGTNGKWIITGPSNGSMQFYPGSIFNVTGNSFAGANTSYTVNSALTGNQFNVQNVVTGASGKIIVSGDVTSFFRSTFQVKLINTNGFDATYTIASKTLVSGNTEITVTGTIPSGTTASVNTLVNCLTPITEINVGVIHASAGANGIAQPATPLKLDFVDLSPIVLSPTATPHLYDVLFRIKGDHASKFVSQSKIFPRNVMYNGQPYAESFTVELATYVSVGDFTELLISLHDPSLTTPILNTADIRGYQDINFSAPITGTTSTDLVTATTYTTTITVDGVAKAISITVPTPTYTFADLILDINTELGTDAVASINGGKIRVTSNTVGATSTISITAGTLFAPPLYNFSSIATAVIGARNSWINYPIPTQPFGYVRYTVPAISSSLQLVGPGSSRYNDSTTWGKAIQNNALHMLENFNSTTAPASPLEGQLWFNPSVPSLSLYESSLVGWNGVFAANWPGQGFLDMNNHVITRVTDATTTYPYVASTTGVGNNDQEAVNLRTADLLYIAKTGGNTATPAVRSGTMTGSLNMNGVSPAGFTTVGINLNSAPIHSYGSSDILFKTGGTGGITFEAASTGSVTVNGSGNVVVTNGNVTVGSGTDKVVVQNNPGLSPTMTFTTTTTGNSVVNLGNNKITNLFTPSSALDAVNKAYVDSLVNGIIWIQPVKDPNLFDDSLSAPPVIDNNTAYHKTYIVKAPGTGDWVGLDNRAVVYDPQQAAWVDILGRVVQAGDRFGVFCEPNDNDPLISLPGGGLTSKAGKIVTVATVAPYTYTDYTPVEPDAFAVTGSNPTLNNLTNSYDRSPHFGHSYTFRGTWAGTGFGTAFKWIEFSGPQMLVDGAGLLYTGNILNVGAGFGITVNADTVQINQNDLNTVYVRRDGTVNMTGNLDLGSQRIINLADPIGANDGVNKTFADTTYVARAGSTMLSSANITFTSGEVLGLPAIPSTGGAATSKTYVDNRIATRVALAGSVMDSSANITFSGGEVLGLPAIPSIGGAATSKTYVDTQLALKSNDNAVVHLTGSEVISGLKSFSSGLNVIDGSNITFVGGSGEVLGLPASPSIGDAATSKTYVDTQLALKAADVAVVHIANPETITGAKTFSAATIMNNALTIAANGSFTNVTASTTGFTVLGTAVTGGGAYSVSLTSGQNTLGVGGSLALASGQGSTLGGDITITGGIGTSTTGGNIILTSGTGPTTITDGYVSISAGNAAVKFDPRGVWLINNLAPTAKNQAIVANAASPASGVPSWQDVAHRVSAAPVNSAAAGSPGDYYADDSFFYVYGTTGWRRIAVSTF